MKPIVLIFIGLVTTYMGLAALNPVLAPLVRELGLSETQGGLIITAAALMWSLSSPFWGRRSEVLGRKRVFVTGMFGFSFGFTLFGCVALLGLNGVIPPLFAFALLMASRGVVGSFFSAVPVAAQAYIADTTTGEERTAGIALLGVANGIGFIVGPALGGVLATFGLLAPVYIAAILPIGAAFLVMWRLPRATQHMLTANPPRINPADARLWPLLLIGFQVVCALVSIQATAGFYIQDKLELSAEATAQVLGIALVASGVGSLVAQLGIVRLLRPAPQTLLRVGLPIGVVGFVAFVLAATPFAMITAFTIVNFGLALSIPGYLSAITLQVKPDEQGAVAGLTASAQGFGAVIGPVLAAMLYELRADYPYILSAVLLALVVLFVWMHPRLRHLGHAQHGEAKQRAYKASR
ncbi:MAG: MFS transporter [Chloroflexales bacterium]|nr:MFS transporter [Chloroflexales bacterium]